MSLPSDEMLVRIDLEFTPQDWALIKWAAAETGQTERQFIDTATTIAIEMVGINDE